MGNLLYHGFRGQTLQLIDHGFYGSSLNPFSCRNPFMFFACFLLYLAEMQASFNAD
jgi:hypothetical protein